MLIFVEFCDKLPCEVIYLKLTEKWNNLKEVFYTSATYETYVDTRNYFKRHKSFIAILLVINFIIIISLVPVFHNLMYKNKNVQIINITSSTNDTVEIIQEKQTDIQPQQDSTSSSSKIVNINTATLDELCQLQGIGPKIANDIIEYRENAGYFERIEDIQNVKGIGPGTFDKIKKFITI